MSFNSNHSNDSINLGNYEEFFILYMDNELNEEQMKMVDDFLLTHPDLQIEFEILMSTKLPSEEFSFNKEDLLSGKMKLSAIDEELLLYIDNELPQDKKKIVELELSSNKDYQLQHEVLLQTKLDASEKIVYPNKKELYRKEERRILFPVWMRVAAIILVIAVMSIFYFNNTSSNPIQPSFATTNNPVKTKSSNQQHQTVIPKQTEEQTTIAKNNEEIKQVKNDERKTNQQNNIEQNQPPKTVDQNLVANNNDIPETPLVQRTTSLDASLSNKAIASLDPSEIKISNHSGVTSVVPVRNTDETATQTNEGTKGSVRGFLRKATRLIERRTGIGAANDNNELLLGAVAIQLK